MKNLKWRNNDEYGAFLLSSANTFITDAIDYEHNTLN